MNKKYWIIGGLIILFTFIITISIYPKKESFTDINNEGKNNKITKYEIGPSQIHGKGVLCTEEIDEGEKIDIAIITNKDKVTITPYFGVYINHLRQSNTQFTKEDDGENEIYYLIASRQISPGEEITKDYDADDIPDFIKGSEESWN
jgi:hypothetical protein